MIYMFIYLENKLQIEYPYIKFRNGESTLIVYVTMYGAIYRYIQIVKVLCGQLSINLH